MHLAAARRAPRAGWVVVAVGRVPENWEPYLQARTSLSA